MLLLLLASNALAAVPTRQAAAIDVEVDGALTNGAVDSDGELVVFTGGGLVHAVHIPTWTVASAQPCDVAGAAVIEVDGSDEVWVGCESGAAHLLRLDGDELVAVTNTEEEKIIFLAMDGEIRAVHASQEFERVYFVGDTGLSTEQVAVFGAVDGSLVADISLGLPDNRATTIGPQHLFVAHDNSFISALNLANNTMALTITGQLIDVDDLAPTARLSAYAVDRSDSVWEYLPTQFGYNALFPTADGVQAIGTSITTDDEYGLFVYGSSVDVYNMAGGALGAAAGSFTIDGTVRDVVTTDSGYSFAGTTDGRVLVWTHRPWIDGVTGSAVAVSEDQEVTVDFTTDRAGDWEIALGGTWQAGGQVLATGRASAAGSVRAELTVGDWDEGDNDVFVRLTDDAGRTGHGRTRFVVDTPPDAVSLDDNSLGFDDQVITLEFTALDAPDIAVYTVYISTTEFTAAEHPTGGPEFDGDDEIVAPIQVTSFTAGSTVSQAVSPLTNNQTYYLAVRATDEGGLEGPMSDVVSGTPRPTFTASQRAGETGGMDCSSLGGRGTPGLALLGLVGLAGLVRRRRSVLAAAAAVGLGLLAAPTPAQAQDASDQADDEAEEDDGLFKRGDDRGDLTAAWGNVEIRYGLIELVDEDLNLVYGKSGNNVLMFEFGPQLYRFVEIDLGIGFFQELGKLVDEDGKEGSGTTMFTAIPLQAAVTGRLHIFDEQILVPYASIGLDAWTYEERFDTASGGKDKLTGTKFGNHWAIGGNLMLDVFSRRRASLLEAQTGINDTYLTFEYRRQRLEGSQGLDLSGTSFTGGLKFDF